MNIYLDIDGVLVGSKSPREDVIELLKFILKKYPNNTYWLTTHCKKGASRCIEWLRQNNFPPDLLEELAEKVQPTDWGALKTDAIDMDQDFVWFDDNLFEMERNILKANYTIDGYFKMDPYDPEAAKKALNHLKSLN